MACGTCIRKPVWTGAPRAMYSMAPPSGSSVSAGMLLGGHSVNGLAGAGGYGATLFFSGELVLILIDGPPLLGVGVRLVLAVDFDIVRSGYCWYSAWLPCNESVACAFWCLFDSCGCCCTGTGPCCRTWLVPDRLTSGGVLRLSECPPNSASISSLLALSWRSFSCDNWGLKSVSRSHVTAICARRPGLQA